MITLNQHKAAFYKRILAIFSDDSAPKMGLGAWFKKETTRDKAVSIEVERNRQLMAVDVQRNTGGNVNSFSNHTEKMYIPPYFEELFDFTQVQYYDVTFGEQNNPTQSQARSMINEASRRLMTLKHKIQRAIEQQRAQVLQTGIVTLINGDNIDYKRKAASKSALTGTDVWSNAAGKPLDDLANGIKFIRQEGKSASREFDLILGAAAFASFMENTQVKNKADLRRISVVNIGTPMFDNTTGLAYHGQVSTQNGTVNLWTYDDFYETAGGSYLPYIEDKNVVLLPRDFRGCQAYAGVPAIKRDKSNAEYPAFIQQVEADFYMNNYLDEKKKAHWFEINSAPLAVPVSVDRVWSLQVEE